MSRLTKQDATTDSGRRDQQATSSGDNLPGAAKEENFGRQANKGILADRVAEELNVPRRTAARGLDAVLDSVRDLLRARGKVAVKGFGTFERRVRKGRAYKHPLTGESIDVANKETVVFKPSDQLITDTRSGAPPKPRRQSSETNADDILFKG